MCLYQKIYHFLTAFWANYFFCLLDHAYTQGLEGNSGEMATKQ
jgi:hypothetical protein